MLGISKETVHSLPEVHYPGRVILIDSAAKARDAVAYLMKHQQIGFDTETRPSFRKDHRYKVSLVQLSVPGECFLFRLKKIGSLDGLMSIFENPDIQKIGLSIKDDFHSLAKLCEFTPAGFVELQTFVKEYQIADNSLQKIFALIFGKRISKNQRLTNWEAPELTESQQSYAAIDAWACVEIYNHLCSGNFHPEESPYHIDDETAMMLQSSVGIHLPIKHDDEAGSDNGGGPSQAIVESTALNGTPVRREDEPAGHDSTDIKVKEKTGKQTRKAAAMSKSRGTSKSKSSVKAKTKSKSTSKGNSAPKSHANSKSKTATKSKTTTSQPKPKASAAKTTTDAKSSKVAKTPSSKPKKSSKKVSDER